MSKFLATAAVVVGGVALIATGVGAAATVGLLGQYAATSATAAFVATAATVAKVAGFAAAALMATSALTAPKASNGGSPDQWKADPDAGIDVVFGDAFNGGHIIYRQAYGPKNKYQSIVTEWSVGPVQSIDTLYVDQIARTIKSGGAVDLGARDYMHEARQRGLCPEPAALTVGPVLPFGWSAELHKLSGKAAILDTFEYDANGKNTFTSIPTCGWRGKGVLCYDARKDSTYPGGSGPQRADDQTTWAWSDNPYVVGATWCLGWRQNGKLVAGVGLPASGLILEQFVEGSNIAEINGWRVGGVKSTIDDKWDVLKDILQAGAGEPLRLGALLGCIVSTPRVSLATIDRDALAQGEISVVAMQARRDRINTLVPRYWSEQISTDPETGRTATTWAEVAAEPIIVAEYVTADRRQTRKQASYPLVQCFAGEEPHQVATLARYDIENAREFGPVTLPLKIRWMGYKPGDVVTVDLPEAGLIGQDVMLLTRGLDAGSGIVTMTARSETMAKHAFALGQTAVPPTSPGLPANAWEFEVPGAAAALQLAIYNSFVVEVTAGIGIVAAAADGTVTVANHTRRYMDGHADVAVVGSTIATALSAGTTVSIAYDDPERSGGAVTFSAYEDDAEAFASAAHPSRHYLGYVTIPATGTSTGGGGGAGGGRESVCVVDATPFLLANADATGPGEVRPSSLIVAGDFAWTQHEVTREWGAYPVTEISFHEADVFTKDGLPNATGEHQFDLNGWWKKAKALGRPAGRSRVAKITVADARTYVTVQPDGSYVLSHNIKQAEPSVA